MGKRKGKRKEGKGRETKEGKSEATKREREGKQMGI